MRIFCHALRLAPGAYRLPELVSEKLVTEDCRGAGNQASILVNATGLKDNNKKLIQQAFHPGLFISRPRSVSLSSMSERVPTLRITKRRKVSSPSPDRIIITNKFSDLPIEQKEDNMEIVKETVKKVTKPSPIILYGIEDVNKLTELLENVATKADFSYKIVNQNQLRINSVNAEVYKSIIDIVGKMGSLDIHFTKKKIVQIEL
ncbi:unnamed protein product [Leptosia nina]|uniref:Uncharacterized protein n=1 Tax=Leptosia nina TaxID=320188 RepID=A0AAV1JMQ6_9NEOP